jgi:hypothetical protein
MELRVGGDDWKIKKKEKRYKNSGKIRDKEGRRTNVKYKSFSKVISDYNRCIVTGTYLSLVTKCHQGHYVLV